MFINYSISERPYAVVYNEHQTDIIEIDCSVPQGSVDGIVKFNVPLDQVYVISETGALSSDVHLPFSNGGPAT